MVHQFGTPKRYTDIFKSLIISVHPNISMNCQMFIENIHFGFYLRKPRLNKPSSIVFAVKFNGLRFNFGTGVKIIPEQWNAATQRGFIHFRLPEVTSILFVSTYIGINRFYAYTISVMFTQPPDYLSRRPLFFCHFLSDDVPDLRS